MQTITIEIWNKRDKQLILMLAKRLGLKWAVSSESLAQKKDTATHLKIIEAGVNASEERLQEMLSWHQQDRSDRELPAR